MGEVNIESPVKYFEPNDGILDYSKLSIGVKLEIEKPSKHITGESKKYLFSAIIRREGSFDLLASNDKENSTLGTVYSLDDDIVELNGGNQEKLGIESIRIEYTSWYYPQVTINFVDVNGDAVMNPQEDSLNKRYKTPPIFDSFFRMPYPTFKLTVKGYLGKAVTYHLVVQDVKLKLRDRNMSYGLTVRFIGRTHGILQDIPMGVLIAASNIGEMDMKFKNTDIKIPTIPNLFNSINELLSDNTFDEIQDTMDAQRTVDDTEKKNIEEQVGGLLEYIDTFNIKEEIRDYGRICYGFYPETWRTGAAMKTKEVYACKYLETRNRTNGWKTHIFKYTQEVLDAYNEQLAQFWAMRNAGEYNYYKAINAVFLFPFRVDGNEDYDYENNQTYALSKKNCKYFYTEDSVEFKTINSDRTFLEVAVFNIFDAINSYLDECLKINTIKEYCNTDEFKENFIAEEFKDNFIKEMEFHSDSDRYKGYDDYVLLTINEENIKKFCRGAYHYSGILREQIANDNTLRRQDYIHQKLGIEYTIGNIMELLFAHLKHFDNIFQECIRAIENVSQAERTACITQQTGVIIPPFPSIYSKNKSTEIWLEENLKINPEYFPELQLVKDTYAAIMKMQNKAIVSAFKGEIEKLYVDAPINGFVTLLTDGYKINGNRENPYIKCNNVGDIIDIYSKRVCSACLMCNDLDHYMGMFFFGELSNMLDAFNKNETLLKTVYDYFYTTNGVEKETTRGSISQSNITWFHTDLNDKSFELLEKCIESDKKISLSGEDSENSRLTIKTIDRGSENGGVLTIGGFEYTRGLLQQVWVDEFNVDLANLVDYNSNAATRARLEKLGQWDNSCKRLFPKRYEDPTLVIMSGSRGGAMQKLFITEPVPYNKVGQKIHHSDRAYSSYDELPYCDFYLYTYASLYKIKERFAGIYDPVEVHKRVTTNTVEYGNVMGFIYAVLGPVKVPGYDNYLLFLDALNYNNAMGVTGRYYYFLESVFGVNFLDSTSLIGYVAIPKCIALLIGSNWEEYAPKVGLFDKKVMYAFQELYKNEESNIHYNIRQIIANRGDRDIRKCYMNVIDLLYVGEYVTMFNFYLRKEIDYQRHLTNLVDTLPDVFESFFSKYRSIQRQIEAEQRKQDDLLKELEKHDVPFYSEYLNIYKIYQKLYNEWGLGKEKLNISYDNMNILNHFKEDISQDFIVDFKKFNPFESVVVDGIDKGFGSYLFDLLGEYGFMLLLLPLDVSQQDMSKMFDMYDYTIMDDAESPTFLAIYGDYGVDSLNENESKPIDFSKTEDTAFVSNESCFGVTYGYDQQRIFTQIEVGNEKPKVTDASIRQTLKISQLGDPDASDAENVADFSQKWTKDDTLYPLFSNMAFESRITMLGNAEIFPTQYYQLNNVPMFHGGYMITNVVHEIKNNVMTTNFVGTKIVNKRPVFQKNFTEVAERTENTNTNSTETETPTSTSSSSFTPTSTSSGGSVLTSIEQYRNKPKPNSEDGRHYVASTYSYSDTPNAAIPKIYSVEDTKIFIDCGHSFKDSSKASPRFDVKDAIDHYNTSSYENIKNKTWTYKSDFKGGPYDGNDEKQRKVYKVENENNAYDGDNTEVKEYKNNLVMGILLEDELSKLGFKKENIIVGQSVRYTSSFKVNPSYARNNHNVIAISLHTNAGASRAWLTSNKWDIVTQEPTYTTGYDASNTPEGSSGEWNGWHWRDCEFISCELAYYIHKEVKDKDDISFFGFSYYDKPRKAEQYIKRQFPLMYYDCPTVMIEAGFHTNKHNMFGYGIKELRTALARHYAQGIYNFVEAYKKES